jgi:hypothetical protein
MYLYGLHASQSSTNGVFQGLHGRDGLFVAVSLK